jgi:hypothetical protein
VTPSSGLASGELKSYGPLYLPAALKCLMDVAALLLETQASSHARGNERVDGNARDTLDQFILHNLLL